jgi:carbonic anhydrase
VEATANEVLDRSPVLKELWEKGELTVVRAVYALDTGEVRVLEEPPATVAHHP